MRVFRRYLALTFAMFVLMLVSIMLFGGAVFAADLPVKGQAPYYHDPVPVPAVPYSWTGFYIGVNAGAGWGMDSATATGATFQGQSQSFNLPVSSQPTSGWLAGATIGYNWQTGPIVLGVEGEFDWTDINGGTACLGSFGCSTKQDWIADVAGRVGFSTLGDRLLVFVKGGVAFSDFTYAFGNSFFGTSISSSSSSTRTGGLLGTGIEYAFTPSWSAKIEYDFIDFGSTSQAFPLSVSGCSQCTLPTFSASIRDTESLLKVGVNYKFGF